MSPRVRLFSLGRRTAPGGWLLYSKTAMSISWRGSPAPGSRSGARRYAATCARHPDDLVDIDLLQRFGLRIGEQLTGGWTA